MVVSFKENWQDYFLTRVESFRALAYLEPLHHTPSDAEKLKRVYNQLRSSAKNSTFLVTSSTLYVVLSPMQSILVSINNFGVSAYNIGLDFVDLNIDLNKIMSGFNFPKPKIEIPEDTIDIFELPPITTSLKWAGDIQLKRDWDLYLNEHQDELQQLARLKNIRNVDHLKRTYTDIANNVIALFQPSQAGLLNQNSIRSALSMLTNLTIAVNNFGVNAQRLVDDFYQIGVSAEDIFKEKN